MSNETPKHRGLGLRNGRWMIDCEISGGSSSPAGKEE